MDSASSVSTKISPDGKVCIETSGGYGTGSDDNFEVLWVEFDYFLETPRYVQTTLKSRDRVEAVESLMHDTLSTEILGCQLDDAFVYTSAEDGHFATGMPRSFADTKGAGVGLDLVTGINTSPADVQVGMCEPKDVVNECRHMRAFVILNIVENGESGRDGTTIEMMDEVRTHLKGETKSIIQQACERGDYNGKFVKDTFIAGISFVKPVKESTTLDHGYDGSLAGISGSELEPRNNMDKAEAYGIILLAGVAVILAAAAFLITKTCRDARRRSDSKQSHQKKPGKKGSAKQDTAAWTDQIVEVESESDAEDLEVTLYLRSPRNASDSQKQGSSPSNNRDPVSSPDICRAELHVGSPQNKKQARELHVRSLRNKKQTKKPTIPFDLYQKKAIDKQKNENEDEETEATASISEITRSTSTFDHHKKLDHTTIEPIYEEEYEI
mmetsp:Transcript_18149/g.51944  ORF Transcript_18149/g.51944 Transcript_18149/m.51944 type:complete len:441 (-) Transcript_18149:1995-3317(-)